MNILFIHQFFVPEEGAGNTRHFELVKRLVKAGHQVTFITGGTSYLTGESSRKSRFKLWEKEKIEGINVIKVWLYSKIHKSFTSRIFAFFSFVISSIIASIFTGKCDVVVATSPPLFQVFSGYVASLLKRCPLVFEVRDLWPAFAVDMGVYSKGSIYIKMATLLERFLYAKADYFISLTPAFTEYLVEHGVARERIYFVPNGPDINSFAPQPKMNWVREKYGLDNKFIAMYTGAHGMANKLETILHAAARLKDYPDIVFLMVGDGKEKQNLIRLKDALGLKNVLFIDPQPKKDMPCFCAAADCCLATLQRIEMFKKVYPNKLFDYMASERPTILAVDGVAREVLEKAGAGIFVEPENPDMLAQSVVKLYQEEDLAQQYGKDGRRYVIEHFNRDKWAMALEKMLQEIHLGRLAAGREPQPALSELQEGDIPSLHPRLVTT